VTLVDRLAERFARLLRNHLNLRFHAIRRQLQREVERLNAILEIKRPAINGFTLISPEPINASARG
jgi:hypothetical protein